MKFDQYKYAVAGVPFREKWNLRINRNRDREEALFARVVRDKEFVVCHLTGSHFRADLDVQSMAGGRQVIEITDLTDNFFDWIAVIERASMRIMIDSCFSNLTDQLNIPGKEDLPGALRVGVHAGPARRLELPVAEPAGVAHIPPKPALGPDPRVATGSPIKRYAQKIYY